MDEVAFGVENVIDGDGAVAAHHADAFAVDAFGCGQMPFQDIDHFGIGGVLARQQDDIDSFIGQELEAGTVALWAFVGHHDNIDCTGAISKEDF